MQIFMTGLIWFALVAHASAQIAAPVASPAFDPNVYQQGAISQQNATFGKWQLVCANVAAQNRRFCNLASVTKDTTGQVAFAMVVSTTDDGRPAALLRMPLSVSLREGIAALPSAGSKSKRTRRFSIVSCDQNVCTSVMPLETADLRTLSTNGQMNFRLHVLTSNKVQQASLTLPSKAIDVIIDGKGFADALRASQSP